MKKLMFVLLGTIVLLSACNKKLKNSEAFIGKYEADATKIEYTANIQTAVGEMTQSNDLTLPDIDFSIVLGAEDDRVIIKLDDVDDMMGLSNLPKTFNATIVDNKIIVDEIIYKGDIELEAFPGAGANVDMKINITGTRKGDAIDFTGTLAGSGTAALGTTFDITGNITGKAIRDVK